MSVFSVRPSSVPSSAASYIREVTVDDDVSLDIEQLLEGAEGCVVWDAALVLTSYIKRLLKTGQMNQVGHVLDLGSGTGVVGLAIAKLCLPNSVTLTDTHSQMALIGRNVERNPTKTQIDLQTLSWDSESDISAILQSPNPYSLITASDCVYGDKSSAPLASLLNRLLDKYHDARIVMSYERRERHQVEISAGVDHTSDFFSALKTFGCQVDLIPFRDHGEFNAIDIALYCIQKPRTESVAKLTLETRIPEIQNKSNALHIENCGCTCGCVPNIKGLFEMAKLRAEHRAKQNLKG